MEKQELLTAITHLSEQNLITKEEILASYAQGKIHNVPFFRKNRSITNILYFIGGLIVILGIALLVMENWFLMTTPVKIITTLGFGLLSYIAGVILYREERFGAVSNAFHFIAAMIIPLGLAVLFNESGLTFYANFNQTIMSGIILLFYSVNTWVFRKKLFTLFTIIYATWFFISLTNLLYEDFLYYNFDYLVYRIFLVGITYICFGYYLTSTTQRSLSDILYGYGVLFVLGAALYLGKWSPGQNIFWELTFPVLVALVIYGSVLLQRKVFLVFGTLYLMVYILKITNEYFSGTFGWPISLVICGLMMIGAGYLSFSVNSRIHLNYNKSHT